ncbi:hypothetical protein GCM10009687_77900 [Asanoa iriomotensis]|uniref:Uncharacterized protein n=1 Tax=Asanoa iriomotensis TaxID=234613 RepID=A0ABQ4C257_9ACTN|nr:hypothetical protein Air01nite_29580 [Asanoa iriomotensis]
MVAGLATWALVLGALAVLSHRTDEPTVREQRTLTQALRVVKESVGHTVSQAGADTVPVISPLSIDTGCRITPMRSGATATGVVRFFTSDPDLLRRLADGYPSAYQATVSTDGRTMRADAGEFVAVRGKLVAPGEVQVTATTGCRPADAEIQYPPPDTTVEPVRILTALGATSVEPALTGVARCPAGGPASTVSASGRITAPPADAGTLDQGRQVLANDKVYAYRRGADEAVAVVPTGEHDVRVYVTKLC